MDYTLHLLVLWLACAAASYAPFGVVLQARAGGGARTGAAAPLPPELLDEYEPYAYAAMPVPALQVLHVVSPPAVAPPARRRRRPAPRPEPAYSEEQSYEQEGADDATVLVYARPNRHGGYSYRRPAAPASYSSAYSSAPYSSGPSSAPYSSGPSSAYSSSHSPAHAAPFVVRIHKYRLNADR